MNEMIVWSPGVTLEAIEKQVILKAFRHFRGNKTHTAQALGIAIRTLDNKLGQYLNEDKEQESRDGDERKKREAFLARCRGQMPDNTGLPEARAVAQAHVSGAASGVRMESGPVAPAQPTMPLPERSQVQGMLPAQASEGRSRRAR